MTLVRAFSVLLRRFTTQNGIQVLVIVDHSILDRLIMLKIAIKITKIVLRRLGH